MTAIIAFDGLNRCGKGTQAKLLQTRLFAANVLSVVVRGDGSRDGSGETLGDPFSPWWRSFRSQLPALEGSSSWFDQWNVAACVLARELIFWKTEIMPELVRKSGFRHGALLVDRSLVSRIMVLRQANEYRGLDSLYTVRSIYQGIDWRDILPDILFNFLVPKQILLSRLDPLDLKYKFRKGIIEKYFLLHDSISKNLPEQVSKRTVHIDGDQGIEYIGNIILGFVNSLPRDLFVI